MSSSSSVLPPELIYMAMSYLSDEEKMRLIRIDPGTFDVLTSDERFIAEFNSREFYVVKNIEDDEIMFSNISSDREYIVEYVIEEVFRYAYIFGNNRNVDKNRHRSEYEKNLSFLDEEQTRNVVNLYDYISSLGNEMVRKGLSHDFYRYGMTLDNSTDGLNSPFKACRDEVQNIRSMVRTCFEGAPLKDVPFITILVQIALDSYNDWGMTLVEKLTLSSNMQIPFQQ